MPRGLPPRHARSLREYPCPAARGAAKYIGRYLARPAIAEYRVVSYGYHKVHYWYADHRTGKRVDVVSPVMKFIYDLVQHIPPKHFRMVGRYGLYSRGKNKESQKVINLWRFMVHKQIEMIFATKERKKKSYREQMLEPVRVILFWTSSLDCTLLYEVNKWHAGPKRSVNPKGEEEE
ncbi:transposase [Paenibacillus sp. IHBB 3054]|uniref:transposase n=1 Tax=Paenibacillus sp. IHBB 3054 TaxID=3425689 RepID=UPI003F66601B